MNKEESLEGDVSVSTNAGSSLFRTDYGGGGGNNDVNNSQFNMRLQQYYEDQQKRQQMERERQHRFLLGLQSNQNQVQSMQQAQQQPQQHPQQGVNAAQRQQQQLASNFGGPFGPPPQPAAVRVQPLIVQGTLLQSQALSTAHSQTGSQLAPTKPLGHTQVHPQVQADIAIAAQEHKEESPKSNAALKAQFGHFFADVPKQDKKKYTNQEMADMSAQEQKEAVGYIGGLKNHMRIFTVLVNKYSLSDYIVADSNETVLGQDTVLIPKQIPEVSPNVQSLLTNAYDQDISQGGPIHPNAEWIPVANRGDLGCLNYDLSSRLASPVAVATNTESTAETAAQNSTSVNTPTTVAMNQSPKFTGEEAKWRQAEMDRWGPSLTIAKHTSKQSNYGLREKTAFDAYYTTCISKQLFSWKHYLKLKGDEVTGMRQDEIEDIYGEPIGLMCNTTHLINCKSQVKSGYLWNSTDENGGYRANDEDEEEEMKAKNKENKVYGDSLLTNYTMLKTAAAGVQPSTTTVRDVLLKKDFLDCGYETIGNETYILDKHKTSLQHMPQLGRLFHAAILAQLYYHIMFFINFNGNKLLKIRDGEEHSDLKWKVSFALPNILVRVAGGAVDPEGRMNRRTLEQIVKYWHDKLCFLFLSF